MPTKASPSAAREYVLGTGTDELARLALQHRFWADAAHSLWRRAKINLGHQVLDIGCGPGFASFDLAQLVTQSGRVVGIDESQPFVDHANAQAKSRGLPHLTAHLGDVQNLAAALRAASSSPLPSSFDLAYARWVLCFVKDPDAVVAGVASLLKPGGRFCINDYFNYRSMTLAPRRASFDKAVAATVQSWEARGGNTDIVAILPRLCEKYGLTVTHLDVHQRICRGNDTMFAWIDVWWRTYAPKLVEMNLLARSDLEQLLRDLDEVRHSSTDFVACPPVYELIAQRH
jgi:SAM-dependent methyltransferase